MAGVNLNALEKLLAEATQGEWEAYVTPAVVAVTVDEHRKAVIAWPGFDSADCGPRAANARLIVALHNAAPELLRLAKANASALRAQYVAGLEAALALVPPTSTLALVRIRDAAEQAKRTP